MLGLVIQCAFAKRPVGSQYSHTLKEAGEKTDDDQAKNLYGGSFRRIVKNQRGTKNKR